jgi:hypothetical protein
MDKFLVVLFQSDNLKQVKDIQENIVMGVFPVLLYCPFAYTDALDVLRYSKAGMHEHEREVRSCSQESQHVLHYDASLRKRPHLHFELCPHHTAYTTPKTSLQFAHPSNFFDP